MCFLGQKHPLLSNPGLSDLCEFLVLEDDPFRGMNFPKILPPHTFSCRDSHHLFANAEDRGPCSEGIAETSVSERIYFLTVEDLLEEV